MTSNGLRPPRAGLDCKLFSSNKNKKNFILGLTFSAFSDRLFPVSERNTMKNQMTMSEIRRYTDDKRKREAKRDTFTLNGNTYTVNNDPKHQADQLAGYCGNNPK